MVLFFLGGCPKATFEFNNQTKKFPYNFVDSSVGNIGSLETCPCKRLFCLSLSNQSIVVLIDTGRPYVYLPCYPNSTWGNEPYYSICSKPPDRQEETSTRLPVVINPYLRLPIDQIAKVKFFYDSHRTIDVLLVTYQYLE